MQLGYESKVESAASYLKERIGSKSIPEFGITLGSGLGKLADSIDIIFSVDYSEIPHFPQTGVAGHEGKLVYGVLRGVPVIGLKGRKHFYEVADKNDGMLDVVFSVHALAELGVPNYFATNAAGGLNPDFDVGDMMIIRSHIRQMPDPLVGREMKFKRLDGSPVWRFQPMNGAYDPQLRELLMNATHGSKNAHEGVYLAVTGPCYETEAESMAFRDGLGADAVGMSTVPEVIVARNRGMKAVGLSCITNKIGKDGTNATNHGEVMAVLNSDEVRKRFSDAVSNFFDLYRLSVYK